MQSSGLHTRFYLAREFVAGRSLLEKLTTHRYSEPEVIDLARQMLAILQYLHGLSPWVIHRGGPARAARPLASRVGDTRYGGLDPIAERGAVDYRWRPP